MKDRGLPLDIDYLCKLAEPDLNGVKVVYDPEQTFIQGGSAPFAGSQSGLRCELVAFGPWNIRRCVSGAMAA